MPPKDYISPYTVTYNRQFETIKIDSYEFSVEMLIALMEMPIGTKLEKNTQTSFVFLDSKGRII